jgi:hypothetical protein
MIMIMAMMISGLGRGLAGTPSEQSYGENS